MNQHGIHLCTNIPVPKCHHRTYRKRQWEGLAAHRAWKGEENTTTLEGHRKNRSAREFWKALTIFTKYRKAIRIRGNKVGIMMAK